ncbi:hypothetical protein K402DRAFT_339832, partial [Aulographum hederae CBS 113979]
QITDDEGHLQYVPFFNCNETARPLEFAFGIEKDFNCTLDFISDPMFHLLEFYIHNDAPLTCRIPSRPLLSNAPSANPSVVTEDQVGALGSNSNAYIPLTFALLGTLQLSHLHISNHLNVLLHAAPKRIAKGVVDAGIAYSVSHLDDTKNVRVVIGDPLTLQFSVRWYPTTQLPSGWRGVGGHVFISTMVYAILAFAAGAGVAIVYFRGFDLPRRLKGYGAERLGGGGVEGQRYNGYGYGVGGPPANGYGWRGPGKVD